MSKNTTQQNYSCFREWLTSMKIKYKVKKPITPIDLYEK
jgi:hypothetical protein